MVEFFDRLYKCALTYGMPYELFWFGDPQDYFVFQDAFADNEKKKHDEDDVTAWLFGYYEMLAYKQVQAEMWGKGRKKKKVYPEEPNSVKMEKEKIEKKRNSVHPLLNKFMSLANAINHKFEDK